jgi:hypothetical protein
MHCEPEPGEPGFRGRPSDASGLAEVALRKGAT